MPGYLDHNATAPVLPEAARAAAAWLAGAPGNPSSVHAAGRRARAAVEEARRRVAEALGARPGDLTFTSGATEALHLAVGGLVAPGGHVVASAVEHPALFGACRAARAQVTRVDVDAWGRLDPADFRAALRPDTALVAVMAAQNELGNVYPVAAVAAAVAPVPVLCDAAQLFGRRPVDVGALGAALVVVSGHKVGAPPGVGALWTRLPLRPWIDGGPQERGRRAGTENVPAIVGLGVAAAALPARLAAMPAVTARRDRLEAGLSALAGFVRHGDPEARLPNTLAFRIEAVDGDLLLAALDLEGLCLSSGSACASGSVEPSPVLRALGLTDDQARCGLRVSLGPDSTDAEVDHLIDALPRLVARAQAA